MYHIALSLLVGVIVTVISAFIFGGSPTSIAYGLIPGIIAGGGFFFWRSRVVANDMTAMMDEVQKILAAPAKPRTQEEQDQLRRKRIDKSIKIIERGYRWDKWHPMIRSQLDAQIGTLLYVDGQNIRATEYLQRATPRNWVAMAMLGAVEFKRNKPDAMKQAFEDAVRFSKKEALLWNVYAWCVWTKGDTDAAIAILNRARKNVPTDSRTLQNLEALSNGKPMRMSDWGEEWLQFRLDDSAQKQAAQIQYQVSKGGMNRRSAMRPR